MENLFKRFAVRKTQTPEPEIWKEYYLTPPPADQPTIATDIASAIAIRGLMDTLRKGRPIQIPSLKIRILPAPQGETENV